MLQVHSSEIHKQRNQNSLFTPSWSEQVRRVNLRFWHWINLLILVSFQDKVWWWYFFFFSTDTIELWDEISQHFENNASKQGY